MILIGWREIKKEKQEKKIMWQRMKGKANEENPKKGSSRGDCPRGHPLGLQFAGTCSAGAALQLMLCQD